jgi:hypothetical protein
MRITAEQQHFWAGFCTIVAFVALCALAAFFGAGCKAMQFGKAGIGPAVVVAQSPGLASGAGSTLTGPANSAGQSLQVAERRTKYFYPDLAAVRYGQPAPPADSPLTPPPVPAAAPAASLPEWTFERTETTLGQHQSASGIIQAAAKLEGFNKIQWFGLLCIVAGVGGLLWCAGHNEGYPLICWKVCGLGVFFTFCDNPFWALLLLVPAAFYAAQKFNLLRLP